MAETGASGDFIEGKLLPEALCLNQFRQPGNDRFTLRGLRHISFLCDGGLDGGYDYRHNARSYHPGSGVLEIICDICGNFLAQRLKNECHRAVPLTRHESSLRRTFSLSATVR